MAQQDSLCTLFARAVVTDDLQAGHVDIVGMCAWNS
jgi:hypothetical protein